MKQASDKDIEIKVKNDGNAIVQGNTVVGKKFINEQFKIESGLTEVKDLGKNNHLLSLMKESEVKFSIKANG